MNLQWFQKFKIVNTPFEGNFADVESWFQAEGIVLSDIYNHSNLEYCVRLAVEK